MRLPRKPCSWTTLLVLALALSVIRPAGAQTPAPPKRAAPAVAAKPAPPALPDYGGRDGVVSTVDNSGAQTMNPLAQAGRAFEALVIVLALVVGGLYLLKRSGLIKGDGTTPWTRAGRSAPPRASVPAAASTTDLITVLGTQTLPNGSGADIHLIAVGSRTFLLGATPQQVTLLTELDLLSDTDAAETPQSQAAFDAYLSKAGIAPEPKTTSRRVAEDALSATADRLQSLLARSRE